MARGHVVAWGHDASGHVMGRIHMNPILNIRMYQVEFTGGEVTELPPISLLSQCMPSVMQMGMSIYSKMH